jgi:hypothetical protein
MTSDLFKTYFKTLSEDQLFEYSVKSHNLKFVLTEELSQEDLTKVTNAIKQATSQIDKTNAFLDGMNVDRNKLGFINDYLDGLTKALDEAQASLAATNFQTGKIANFLGAKVGAPGIIQGALAVYTKATDFGNALADTIIKIEQTLAPLAKGIEDKSMSIGELIDTGKFPISREKFQKSINDVFVKTFGGGFFNKAKNLFKMTHGPEKKILQALPRWDPKAAAASLGETFLSLNLDELIGVKPPPQEDPATINDVAEESIEAEKEIAGEEDAEFSGEEDAPEDEEEITAELEDAARDAVAGGMPPGEAMANALDDWMSGLSGTSQKTLSAAGRFNALKSGLQDRLIGVSSVVEKEIENAIADWRSDHEETLIKSKRFAKKNFDSLQKLIPQIASQILKNTNESHLPYHFVKEITYAFLNRHCSSILNENDVRVARWAKIAGVGD